VITPALTPPQQPRARPYPLVFWQLVIPAELLIEPAGSSPSIEFGIRALLALGGPLPDSLEEPGFIVHRHPDCLDNLERDWIPINQIKVRHFTKTGFTLTAQSTFLARNSSEISPPLSPETQPTEIP